MINIILLGPPGSGKGTQSAKITDNLSMSQIAPGDLLRNAVKDYTVLGKKAEEYMKRGDLVPDDIIIGLMKDKIESDTNSKGFILDGFPRTITQAVALDKILVENVNKDVVTIVICIEIDDSMIIKRLNGRRICNKCGAVYHLVNNPPLKDGICDLCSGELILRNDDQLETIMKRLAVYKGQTAQLKDYYRGQNNLCVIDGSQNPDKVYENIKEVVDNGSC